MADVALQLLVLVLPALVTQRKVVAEGVVRVLNVDARIDVLLTIVLLGPTAFTLEAVLALPLVWDALDLWFETESMVRSVAEATKHQLVLLSSLTTYLAALAVEASPV